MYICYMYIYTYICIYVYIYIYIFIYIYICVSFIFKKQFCNGDFFLKKKKHCISSNKYHLFAFPVCNKSFFFNKPYLFCFI